jgi:CubicO group peptidase (beta-lactamase class C family)
VVTALLLASSWGRAQPLQDDGRIEQVDALFKEWDRPGLPGCGLGIIEDGRFIYQRGYGMANLEYDIPISSPTVFRIGSVSKQFSAMAILLAAAEGTLSLDDDVRKYVPELPDYSQPVTIRQMLHHTSGLRDYIDVAYLAGKGEAGYDTDEEAVEILERQDQLNFTPGDEYLYSNSGYFLLSQIIARVTGQSLREYAAEKIFQPLGMSHTHFHDDTRGIVKNRATGYRPKKDDGFEISVSTIDVVGDGGIFTTVEDLARWDQNSYDKQVGGEALLTEMVTPGTLNGGEKLTYALGLGVTEYRGLAIEEHGGSWVGYRAGMLRFPEQKFSVICLCNRSDAEPTELARKIADIYLADQLQPELAAKVAVPEEVLQERVGAYWNERTGEFVDLKLEEGQLVLTVDEYPYRAMAMEAERFIAIHGWDKANIHFTDVGNELGMRIQFDGQRPFEYKRVQSMTLTREQLQPYEGTYYCEEVGASYRVRLDEEGKLILQIPNQEAEPLEPMFPDGFRWEWGSVVFDRDPHQGGISGFRLNTERARNFQFVRAVPD